MATLWRLPWPELLALFVGVWLCLALGPSAAARLPSDRLVFPSESQPKLESRLKEIKMEMELAEVSRLTNVTLLMMPQEAKKDTPRTINTSLSRGSEKPSKNTTGKVKEEFGNSAKQEGNSTSTRNQTYPASESKVITFAIDPETNNPRPWEETEDPLTVRTQVVLEPRITLETTKICPKGFVLSSDHCRKEA